MTKIGVISDTHGNVLAVQQAIRILDGFDIDLTIHCGDVGAEVVSLFGERRVHFVRGNMDDVNELREVMREPQFTFHGEFGELEVEGCRVAFLHGHDIALLHHTIHSGHWDLVCHGHTHAFSNLHNGRTRVLNPGALSRTSRPSIALVTLPSLEVAQISVA